MGKFERRRQSRAACGMDGPEYYHELVNPYFISLSKQTRLCPECHSKTAIEPTPVYPNLADEVCTNEECGWSHGLIPPKSMMVPDGYGLPGGMPKPSREYALPSDYSGPSPMQMVICNTVAVYEAEQARYGTGERDPEMEEVERLERLGEYATPPRKQAQVLPFRPRKR